MFRHTQLAAFMVGLQDARVVFTDETLKPDIETVATVTSQAIGAESADRIVVVGVGTVDTATNSVSSVTINGVSATIIDQTTQSSAGIFSVAALCYARVPTGTSVSIVVTWADQVFRTHIGVWALYGVGTLVPHDFGKSAVDPGAVANMDVPAGGVAVGYSAMYDTSLGGTYTWSNITEDFDVDGAGTNEQYSGASIARQAAQVASTITADPSAASAVGTVVASWR